MQGGEWKTFVRLVQNRLENLDKPSSSSVWIIFILHTFTAIFSLTNCAEKSYFNVKTQKKISGVIVPGPRTGRAVVRLEILPQPLLSNHGFASVMVIIRTVVNACTKSRQNRVYRLRVFNRVFTG